MKYLAQDSQALKNGIYIIYMGFCRAICQYIAASTSDFFFVLGLRPRTKKKSLGFGAIYRHIALQNPIYTLHIYIYHIYVSMYIYMYVYTYIYA